MKGKMMKPKDMGKDHKHMMLNMPPKGMMNGGKKAGKGKGKGKK